MTVSLSGLDAPWLDGRKKAKTGFVKRYGHQHSYGSRSHRSGLSAPRIISDIEDVQSMVDGKYYSSRSKWRTHLKDHGMIEMGNDMPEKRDPKPAITEADVAEAYEMCEQGAGAKCPEYGPDGRPASDWADLAESQEADLNDNQ